MRKIIGFIGLKRSGKSTACQIIRNQYYSQGGSLVYQHNFKDGLVLELIQNFPKLLAEMCRIYDHCESRSDRAWEVSDLFREKPPLMRALMQEYGTEVRRGDDESYWVHQWRNNLPVSGMVLVDDVRFENEARAVRSSEGILIRLVRKDMVNLDTHKSEIEQDGILADYTIETRWGEQSVLESKLIKILNEI